MKKKLFKIIWNVFIFLALTFLVLFFIIYVYNNNERIKNLYEGWTNDKKGTKGEKGDRGDKGEKGDPGEKGDDGDKDNHGPLLTSEEIRKRENRNFQHSEFKPTGYFLKEGIAYEITLNRKVTKDEADIVKLTVGQWGNYKNPMINQTENTFSDYEMSEDSKKVSLTAKNPGVLYVNDSNQTNLKIINITTQNQINIIKIPTFQLNKTDQNKFIEQVKKTKSPFVEFVSKHYLLTMQTDIIKNEVLAKLKYSFNEILLHWDNVWNWSNEIYNLNEKTTDINHKYSQYIHIANADDDDGYANATNNRIMFQNSTDAGKNLFLKDLTDQWGLWHETGHTYQTTQYEWNDIGEVIVNISSLYIQQKLGIQLRIYKENEKQQAIKKYLAQPNEKKDFNKLSGELALWTKLGMFWQLQMGFGDNFYPLLNQEYRKINNGQDPNADPRFNNDEKKMQEFIKITSQVTGYNLTQFFNEWGIKLTAETENIISKYKPLTKPIWNNIGEPTTEHNPIVQKN